MRREQLSDDVVIYQADCLEIRDELIADCVVSDPPYGMEWDTDTTRFPRGRNDWPEIIGDDAPFDPAPWLGYKRVILWGYHYFAQRLPHAAVLVWMKKRPDKYGTFLSDCELAWFSNGVGVYAHEAASGQFGRNAESGLGRPAHPMQKPISLMQWCVGKTEGVVLDPYMGSGTTGVACVRMRRPFIGVEIQPQYFEAALRRIDGELKQGRLFD